ncbi:BnaC01g24080D [Brassica napus]|uniref:BnaC01g24080D protein n=2 Tax=Brassica napus TaxID=3708 RepID=A0A078GGG5_BRANA|nr:BnaC01g24080D [Brassica napus]
MAVSSVRYAKSLGFNDTQLGCEDAGSITALILKEQQ